MWGSSFRGLICKSRGTVWSLHVENGRALLIWSRDNHIMNSPLRKTEVIKQVCPELSVPGNDLSSLILHSNDRWHSSLKLHLCSANLKRKHSKYFKAQLLFCSLKKKPLHLTQWRLVSVQRECYLYWKTASSRSKLRKDGYNCEGIMSRFPPVCCSLGSKSLQIIFINFYLIS